QGLQTPAYGDGRAACAEIFPCPARSEATAIKKAPQGTRGLEWTRSKPRGALGHDSSVTGLCDRVMKGGGLFPMARQIARGPHLAPPPLYEGSHRGLARRLVAVAPRGSGRRGDRSPTSGGSSRRVGPATLH